MRFSVTSYQSCPVHSNHYRKILKTDIMDRLIKSPLQERRIYGKDRLHSPCRKSGGKSHGMLFRDSHIKKPLRKHPREPGKTGSIRHRRCNRNNLFIVLPNIGHYFRKDIRIRISCTFVSGFSALYFKRTCPVKPGRILLCRSVSFSFFRNHMHQHRMIHPPGLMEHPYKSAHVMSVHRTQISDTHIFKKHTWNKELFNAAFCPLYLTDNPFSSFGKLFQGILHASFQSGVCLGSPQPVEIPGHASYIFRNGHIVVIQYDYKIAFQMRSIVQGFISHASCHGAVADN